MPNQAYRGQLDIRYEGEDPGQLDAFEKWLRRELSHVTVVQFERVDVFRVVPTFQDRWTDDAGGVTDG